MAKRYTPAWRANVARGTKRTLKPWKDGLNVLPSHVRAFLQRGQVAESMRPMVPDATMLIGDYVEQLGGEAEITPGQRVHLAALFRARIVLEALFSRVLRQGDAKALEAAGPLLSSEREAVKALGLRRVEKHLDLATYRSATSRLPRSAKIARSPPTETHRPRLPGRGVSLGLRANASRLLTNGLESASRAAWRGAVIQPDADPVMPLVHPQHCPRPGADTIRPWCSGT